MINQINCAALAPALESLRDILRADKKEGIRTLIFCSGGYMRDIQKTVCDAVGGTFDVDIHTFSSFADRYGSRKAEMLSGRQSVSIIRRMLQDEWGNLSLSTLASSTASSEPGARKITDEDKLTPTEAAGSVYDAIYLLMSACITPEMLNLLYP